MMVIAAWVLLLLDTVAIVYLLWKVWHLTRTRS